MRIRKYDFDFSRRHFLEKTAKGIGTTGVLAHMWAEAASTGEIGKAYPDELMSIEMFTKGKIKTGDQITAANVDVVKELIDPIIYENVKNQGRKITIVPTTRDITTLYNKDFLEATLKNKGQAKFGEDGNICMSDGSKWKGGTPFTEPKDGKEALTNC